MLYAFILFAEKTATDSGSGGTGGAGGGIFNNLIILLPIILMLYLLIVVLPGRRRQEKERQEMISKMEKGTEVLTIAGIYGTIVSVSPDKDEIVVKVDDGTRLKMTKSSIARNITAEEAARQAKEQQKK